MVEAACHAVSVGWLNTVKATAPWLAGWAPWKRTEAWRVGAAKALLGLADLPTRRPSGTLVGLVDPPTLAVLKAA